VEEREVNATRVHHDKGTNSVAPGRLNPDSSWQPLLQTPGSGGRLHRGDFGGKQESRRFRGP